MRYLVGFVCVLALGVVPVVGCGENEGDPGGSGGSTGTGGDGGIGGGGGTGGTGGTGGSIDLCEGVTCEDTECKSNGVCDANGGVCDFTLADDGTACSEGECLDGACAPVGAFRCTEQGIRNAIARGGGPHFFACDGPTNVVIEAEILIDNDVILDGEGELAVDGNAVRRPLRVDTEITAELRRVEVTSGFEAPDAWSIVNLGALTVADSAVSGAAIFNGSGGTLTLTNSMVSGNTALTIGGSGIYNEGILTLTDSTVLGHMGNGIVNSGTATLTNSTVSGNSHRGGFGAGIYNTSDATLSLTNSTVSGNTGYIGAGIYNSGTATLTNSTVSGNTAAFDGAGWGGGILNNSRGTLTLTNSTVSGNTALTIGGSGIYNFGALTLTNSTVAGNTAPTGVSGIYINAGTVTVTNSLIDGDCDGEAITSTGYNIESPLDTCGFNQPTDQVDVAAEAVNLGPLADNGGPTTTHALLSGSVAIDMIPEAMCVDADAEPLTQDQRGEPRPAGAESKCDVGSFELQLSP